MDLRPINHFYEIPVFSNGEKSFKYVSKIVVQKISGELNAPKQ